MKIELLNHTPLWVCAKAIRKCWSSEDKSDSNLCKDCWEYLDVTDEDVKCSNCGQYGLLETGPKDKALIERIGNKNKHASTLEHLVYSFDIDGISRACLQELARHRIASLSVKSSRYTLKELKNAQLGQVDFRKFVVMTNDNSVNDGIMAQLGRLKDALDAGISNDVAKFLMPEAYKTSLVWTINARALQNFLVLRSSKSALWEIRDLAQAIYNQLPEEHKYLFEYIYEEKQ